MPTAPSVPPPGHVEDSKAAVPPTLMGSGKKDEPEKDYITDENGNLIDPDTGRSCHRRRRQSRNRDAV